MSKSPEMEDAPVGIYEEIVAAESEPIDVSQFNEMTLKELADVLSLTIKNDDYNKIITYLCMISTYTDSSQINISFNSQSSTGKTYTVTEVAKLFPDEDKIELSGASPTAFFYKEGVQDKVRKCKIVPFARKILILSEQPNSLLQEKLRPLLSHDKWELEYLLTNKSKGSNRADTVVLQGWPATVFCSASMKLDEQEVTRAILLSPEITDDKIKAGVHLQAQRGANEKQFEEELESNSQRTLLKQRILAIREANVGDIFIENPDEIEARFHKMFPKLKPRNMRDMAHLMQLIKAIALFNVWFRRREDGTVVANQSDVDRAFKIWEAMAESQNMNVSPTLMQFYKDYILTAYIAKAEKDYETRLDMQNKRIGVTRSEIASQYWQKQKSMLNDDWFRKQVLPQLQNSGMIEQKKPEYGERRSYHVIPRYFPGGKNPLDQKYIGNGGGVDSLSQEVMDTFFAPAKKDHES